MSQNKKEKIKKSAHIIAGVVIMLHGLEKYESGHGSYIFFVLSGLLFLSIAIFHHSLKSKYRWIDTVFFGIEATLSLIIAYDYFHLNKNALAITYVFAGTLQLFAIYMFSKRLSR